MRFVSPCCHYFTGRLKFLNRTDRLHAINEALRRTGPTGSTAAQLAERLEVSIRTIKRDVSALQQAGVLIWAQPGPGGGYMLDSAASLPPVAFTPSQAVAVAMALALLPPSSPFSVDGHSASGKVLDTLGSTTRTRTQTLAKKVWVDREPAERKVTTSVLRSIERSLTEELVLSIRYRTATGLGSARRVEPVLAAWTAGRWYLVAHCQHRNNIRWFRFDRIERADITHRHYVPKPTASIGRPPDSAHPVA